MAETVPGGRYLDAAGRLVDAHGKPLPAEKPVKAPKSESAPPPAPPESAPPPAA